MKADEEGKEQERSASLRPRRGQASEGIAAHVGGGESASRLSKWRCRQHPSSRVRTNIWPA